MANDEKQNRKLAQGNKKRKIRSRVLFQSMHKEFRHFIQLKNRIEHVSSNGIETEHAQTARPPRVDFHFIGKQVRQRQQQIANTAAVQNHRTRPYPFDDRRVKTQQKSGDNQSNAYQRQLKQFLVVRHRFFQHQSGIIARKNGCSESKTGQQPCV